MQDEQSPPENESPTQARARAISELLHRLDGEYSSLLAEVPEERAQIARQAIDRLRDAESDLVRVAMLGPSGAGKSAVINAIVGDSVVVAGNGRTTPCVIALRFRANGSWSTGAGTKQYLTWKQYTDVLTQAMAGLGLSAAAVAHPPSPTGEFVEVYRSQLASVDANLAVELTNEVRHLLDGFRPDLFDGVDGPPVTRAIESNEDYLRLSQASEGTELACEQAMLARIVRELPLSPSLTLHGVEGIEILDLPGSGVFSVKDRLLFRQTLPQIETVLLCTRHAGDEGTQDHLNQFGEAVREVVGSRDYERRVLLVATFAESLIEQVHRNLVEQQMSKEELLAGPLQQWQNLNVNVYRRPGYPYFVSLPPNVEPAQLMRLSEQATKANDLLGPPGRGPFEGIANEGTGIDVLRHETLEHLRDHGVKTLWAAQDAALVRVREAFEEVAQNLPAPDVKRDPTPLEVVTGCLEDMAHLEATLKNGSGDIPSRERVRWRAIEKVVGWALWSSLISSMDTDGYIAIRGRAEDRTRTTSIRRPTFNREGTSAPLGKVPEYMKDLRQLWTEEVRQLIEESDDQVRRQVGNLIETHLRQAGTTFVQARGLVAAADGQHRDDALAADAESWLDTFAQWLGTLDIWPEVESQQSESAAAFMAEMERDFPLNSYAKAVPWRQKVSTAGESYRPDHLSAVARVRFHLAEAAGQLLVERHRGVEALLSNIVGEIYDELKVAFYNEGGHEILQSLPRTSSVHGGRLAIRNLTLTINDILEYNPEEGA